MFILALPLMLAQPAQPVSTGRIARPAPVAAPHETLMIVVTSPDGPLWQGSLRVTQNDSASYQQNRSQAALEQCAPGLPYDRSDREHLNLTVSPQHNLQWGSAYRVDVSWARPFRGAGCGHGGTRTVQLNQIVLIEPGMTAEIEGDAGLRVRISRTR